MISNQVCSFTGGVEVRHRALDPEGMGSGGGLAQKEGKCDDSFGGSGISSRRYHLIVKPPNRDSFTEHEGQGRAW